jgi:hypothetical protein
VNVDPEWEAADADTELRLRGLRPPDERRRDQGGDATRYEPAFARDLHHRLPCAVSKLPIVRLCELTIGDAGGRAAMSRRA